MDDMIRGYWPRARGRRSVGAALLVSALAVGAANAVVAQAPAKPSAAGVSDSALVFTGTTVVDVETGRLRAGQTVVVVGRRIQAVGPAAAVRVPAAARVLPADGTYLIPGLWDMHVHPSIFPDVYYPLFVANGVTGIREMAAPYLDSVRQWRREIAAGTRVGPRVVTSGPSIFRKEKVAFFKDAHAKGLYGIPVYHVGADTPEEGRRMVDSLQAAGADLIKIHDPQIPRETFFAIAAEARRLGIPFAGHSPEEVTVLEASDSGQRSFEHIIPDCVKDDEFQVEACRKVAARFRRNGSWYTIGPVNICIRCQLPGAREATRYRIDSLYSTPPSPDEMQGTPLAEWAETYRKYTSRARGRKMYELGMPLLLGTDVAPLGLGMPTDPGFSLHDALWSLTLVGLPPLEVLRTVTLNPARYFRATDSLGSVAAGKVADLVLLDANPLADIFNTRRIRAVVADGRFFDRPDLDALLDQAERAARTTPRYRGGDALSTPAKAPRNATP